jgi:hypothetical protein
VTADAVATSPLTPAQAELSEFMLRHGGPEALSFLPQLEKALVTDWRCPCGCASFNFSITGMPEPPPGVHVLGDFVFGPHDAPSGILIFSSGGVLSGVEVYGLGGDAPSFLPAPAELRPFS